MKEIHKIAAVIIKDDKFFMVRKVGKDIWTNLGGKPEAGETEEQALVREIDEEIHCKSNVVRKLADFEAPAVFDKDCIVKLSSYLVELEGEPRLDDPELEECMFIPRDYKENGIKLPQSVEDQMIPFLVDEGLLQWDRA